MNGRCCTILIECYTERMLLTCGAGPGKVFSAVYGGGIRGFEGKHRARDQEVRATSVLQRTYANAQHPRRCNLTNVLLQMKAMGIHDILSFQFLESPSVDAGVYGHVEGRGGD